MPTTVTFLQGVRFMLFFWAMTLLSSRVYSQTGCDCPAVSSCGPCSGGLTQLVLKFNGEGTVIARVILDGNNKTLTSTYNAATKILTINSFVDGQPFGNGSVSVTLIAVLGHTLTDETITTSCGSPIYAGSVYGNLTVLSATSVTGSTLCCASSDVDQTAPVFTGCPANKVVNRQQKVVLHLFPGPLPPPQITAGMWSKSLAPTTQSELPFQWEQPL
jgi:hypothetical protein